MSRCRFWRGRRANEKALLRSIVIHICDQVLGIAFTGLPVDTQIDDCLLMAAFFLLFCVFCFPADISGVLNDCLVERISSACGSDMRAITADSHDAVSFAALSMTLLSISLAAEARSIETAFGALDVEGAPKRVVTLYERALNVAVASDITPLRAVAIRGGEGVVEYIE